MDALDEMKNKWASQKEAGPSYDANNLSRLVQQRAHRHARESVKYFWASMVLQILVYALYAHVIVKHFNDPFTISFALLGILIYIPFTYMLLRRFKTFAALKPDDNGASSLFHYVTKQRAQLQAFFRFKLRYELLLIPLSTLFGTLLVFHIYVPGGPMANPNGVWITMVITLLSCYLAIKKENRKSFHAPLAALSQLLDEFNDEGKTSASS